MTLVFETQAHGRLWLGGEKAVHNSRMLAENEVGYVWPAYRGACPESPNVQVLDLVDGSGVANGDIELQKVLNIVTDACALLMSGKSVLVACHNGAHRSATLACMILIRLTAWSASEAATYLTTMRNIVDLNSRAPASHRRTVNKRPLDFLAEVQGRLCPAGPMSAGKAGLGFVPLRRKALDSGFEARFPGLKSLSIPGLKATRDSSPASSAGRGSSFAFPSGSDQRGSWTFVPTPVSTPGGSSTGEGSELRRGKIRLLMEDLTQLNKRLKNHMAPAAPLTLKDSTGNVAAVVVDNEMTLPSPQSGKPTSDTEGKKKEASAASEPGVPEGAKAAASEPGVPEGAKAAASEPGVTEGEKAASPKGEKAEESQQEAVHSNAAGPFFWEVIHPQATRLGLGDWYAM